MASEAQIKLLHDLYDERDIDAPSDEELTAMSVEDATLEITVLMRDVESKPASEEQIARMQELCDELGPRRDGKPWQLPTETGRAAALIPKLEGWVRAKQYSEKLAATKERLATRGVTFRDETPASVEADAEIPF